MSDLLDDFLKGREMAEQARARAAVKGAVVRKQNPDAAAREASTARRYATTPSVVAAKPDLFDAQDAEDNVVRATERAPVVGRWLTMGQHNAAMSHDDLDNLADVAGTVTSRKPARSVWQGFLDLSKGLAGQGAQPSAGGIDAGNIARGATRIAGELKNEVTVRGTGAAFGAGTVDVGTSALGTIAATSRFSNFGKLLGPLATLAGAYGQQAADDLAPKGGGNATQGVYSGVRSLPTAAAALVGGIAVGSAKSAAVLTGAAAGGQSYITAKRAGLSDDKANSFATVDGLIEAATEYLPFQKLLGGAGEGFAKRFIKSTAAELPGEQLATLGQDFNQWAMIDSNNGKSFDDYLAERPAAAQQTLVATLVGSGVINTAISAAEAAGAGIERRMAASRAEEDVARLETLTKFREASKVASRDVGSFEDFVRTAAEDGDAGMTDVYIDAQQFAETFDQSELSPEEIGQMTGLSPDEIAQAVATGGDLRIPIEIFAGRLAAEDIGKQLVPHLRIDPDGMSQTEAQTFMQGAQEEFTAAATQQFDRIVQTDEERASGTRVLENIATQLDATKRFTPAINRGYAALHAAFATTMGRKLGLTAEEFNQRYGLKVQSGETAAPTFDQNSGKPTVNIGLDIPGGGKMDAQVARDALAAAGVSITQEAIHQSDSEQTLVAELDKPLTEEQVFALSEALGQEAVAAHTGTEGILAGPQAANWGSFNPEFFLNLDGSRMAEPVAQFDQSAAPLQALPLSVAGTGPGGRVRNQDVGKAFTLRHEATYGRALDPASKDDYAVVLDAMLEDYRNQLEQPDNGEAWYSDDIAEAIRITTTILPELEIPVRRDIFMTVAALLSPQQGPIDNWSNAIDAMTGYSITGRFALKKPSGMQFGVKSHTTGLQLFQHLIDTKGEIGALVWLQTEHTGRELAEMRRDSGIFEPKDKLAKDLPNETNLNDVKLGVYMFGPKVGDFAQNSAGLDQSAVTVDLWMARTYNRLIGRLTDVSAQRAAEGGLADTLRGRTERDLVKSLVRDAAKEAGIAPSAMQAALWYFEQRLYRNHGIKSESTSFSDAARAAARKRDNGSSLEGDQGSFDGPARTDVGEGVPQEVDSFWDGPRVFNQSPVYNQGSVAHINPLDLFRYESLYPRRAMSHEDGRVYTDTPVNPRFNDRLADIAAKLGVPEIIAVEKDDPRLQTGTPLWHTEPVIDSEGRMVLDHWGPAGIDVTDPNRWGESGTAPKSEKQRIGTALPRTFFGIASGQPGGYVIEFPGMTRYTARVPATRVYDIARDPDKLKQGDGVGPLERRIKDAGYAGYWSNNEQLGLVATIFEPVPVQAHQPAAYFQDQVFYSALGRAVEQTKTTKAPAAQWIATLRKTPGVKQEELEWSGLLDFLNMQDGPVTRDQLLELLMNGGIKVDEVLLGDKQPARRQGIARIMEDLPGTTEAEAAEIWDEDTEQQFEYAESGLQTQFKSWSSNPQNDTYRELLITLPIGDGSNPDRVPSTHWDTEGVIAHARFMEKTDADGKRVLFIEEVQSDWHQKGRDQGYSKQATPEEVRAAEQAVTEAVRAVDEAEAALRAKADPLLEAWRARTGDSYGQMKFDNEYGRYKRTGQFSAISDLLGYTGVRGQLAEEVKAADAARLRLNEANQAANRATQPQGVPNAPFKSTWPSLVMKRMIRWAVDHGYERVAWTTGEQQAERYNLSTAVGTITYRIEEDGRVKVNTEGDRGYEALRQYGAMGPAGSTLFTRKQAEETFGQEITRKMWAGEGRGADSTGHQKLEGSDLRVGGEGMKAFYDRNLVNITNDLIKKHGAKVGPVQVVELAEIEAAPVPSDTQPGFDITSELAAAASNGFPLFQNNGAPRGQVAFAPDITTAPSVITLLRGADLSTFIHESGHFFFEVMTDIAGRADAPAEIVNDVRTLLNHTGVESLTKWQDMTTGERRQHHEEIARLFEAYIFEGTSPSSEMKSLFDKMKEWMKNVYRSLSALNVNLTPEVSGVFDRMLASDQEISEAQADQGLVPFFKDKPEGLSDAEWAAYQAQGLEATQEAAGALERRSLRDMRYAGKTAARELKRLQREVSDRRAVVREEVVDELGASPVYRAMRYLRTGKLDDSEPGGEPYKLYTPEVRELLRLGEDPMPDALRGMTSTENGVNPAQIAELFGFTSPDHMIRELLFASPFNAAVEAETDQRMRERYGELADGEQLEAAVQGAIHNEVRGRFVATELAAMQNAVGKRRVMNEAAKRMAKQLIDRIKLRNLRPGQFEAAERRAAKAALKAGAGNLAEAATHKRNQLLQFHAAKAAREAVDEADKARDYLRKFSNKNTRVAIDQSFLDQIDKVLEQFELRQTSDRESDRRQALADWIASMREQGFEPMIDPDTLRVLGRRAFRDLTVAEMREVVDSVKNIEFLGRQTKKMLTAIDKANLDQAAAEVIQSVTDNAARIVPEIIGGKTWWERVQGNIADFFAMHRKFANVVYVMDGNRYGGPVWERFVRAMNKAGDTETRMNGEASERLSKLFEMLKGENLHTRRYIPEINASLRLEDMIAIGLNWGNSANRQRLMDGEKWTPEQVDVVLGQLTAKHWDFIEAAWREIDSYWPQIKAKQERVTGVAPEKVEAEPFQIEIDGELRLIPGGYYPIKYDPDRSSKAEADTQAEVLRQITGGLYANASTRRGHTKARAEKVERAVRKEFGVIFEHTAQVIHDLAWHETLIDMNRLLKHKGVDAAIRQHYGPETLRWMRKSLEDIAVGDLPATNGMERGLNYIRSGASIAGLGWNLWTTLLQPVGLTQSWSRIGTKHVGRGIADLFGSPAQMNAKVEWVYVVSPFMRSRGDTMQREINEIRNRVAEKGPLAKTVNRVVPEPVTDAIGASFFVLIAKAQLIADLPTWLGQYNKSLEAGEPEDRAVALADQAVIDSQGSGMIKDLAGVQKGNAWQKLWTNFYSYFSATYNLMSDRTQQLKRVGPTDLPMYAVDVALLTFVPATLTSLMYSLLKGDDDDDAEDIAKKVAGDNINYMLGLMLGMREVGGAISGMAGYTGPAGARAFVELGKFGKQVGQGELDEALLRSANMVGGVLLHYPAGQVDRTVRGLQAVADGKGNLASPLVGPPPKS